MPDGKEEKPLTKEASPSVQQAPESFTTRVMDEAIRWRGVAGLFGDTYRSFKATFGEIRDDVKNSAPVTYLGQLNRVYLDWMLRNVPETYAERRAFNSMHSKFVEDIRDLERMRALLLKGEEVMREGKAKNRRDSFEDLEQEFDHLNAYYSRKKF